MRTAAGDQDMHLVDWGGGLAMESRNMECKEQPRSLADESQLAVEEASIKESRDLLFSLRLLPTPPESVTQNDFWRRVGTDARAHELQQMPRLKLRFVLRLAQFGRPGQAWRCSSTTNATQTNELQACTRSAAAGWPLSPHFHRTIATSACRRKYPYRDGRG